jgi:hypothetical protein
MTSGRHLPYRFTSTGLIASNRIEPLERETHMSSNFKKSATIASLITLVILVLILPLALLPTQDLTIANLFFIIGSFMVLAWATSRTIAERC